MPPSKETTFGGQKSRELMFGQEDEAEADEQEQNYTYNDDSKYKAHQLRTLLAENMSDLDALNKKFAKTLSDEGSTEAFTNFGQTQKYDHQRDTLAEQLHEAKHNRTGVFNPFESKINEHADEDQEDGVDGVQGEMEPAPEMGRDNSFDRE